MQAEKKQEVKQVLDSFTMCYCGFEKTNHRFRHIFEPRTTVTVIKENSKFIFEFDAKNFKTSTIETCNFPNCSGTERMHRGGDIHKFEPKKTTYKIIHLCVPKRILEIIEQTKREEDPQNKTFGLEVFLKIENYEPHDRILNFNEDDESIKFTVINS